MCGAGAWSTRSESLLRVHWVAVPKALRARRVNRRRRQLEAEAEAERQAVRGDMAGDRLPGASSRHPAPPHWALP
eukprot:COSAG01_NODE_38_length_33931_cov_75.163632_10_plen_75_part_00